MGSYVVLTASNLTWSTYAVRRATSFLPSVPALDGTFEGIFPCWFVINRAVLLLQRVAHKYNTPPTRCTPKHCAASHVSQKSLRYAISGGNHFFVTAL
jgi:hypothetical protein